MVFFGHLRVISFCFTRCFKLPSIFVSSRAHYWRNLHFMRQCLQLKQIFQHHFFYFQLLELEQFLQGLDLAALNLKKTMVMSHQESAIFAICKICNNAPTNSRLSSTTFSFSYLQLLELVQFLQGLDLEALNLRRKMTMDHQENAICAICNVCNNAPTNSRLSSTTFSFSYLQLLELVQFLQGLDLEALNLRRKMTMDHQENAICAICNVCNNAPTNSRLSSTTFSFSYLQLLELVQFLQGLDLEALNLRRKMTMDHQENAICAICNVCNNAPTNSRLSSTTFSFSYLQLLELE